MGEQVSERDELARMLHTDDLLHGRVGLSFEDIDPDVRDWYRDNADAALVWFAEHRTKVLTDAARTIGALSAWSFEQAMEFVTALDKHRGPRVGTVTSVRDLATSPGAEEPDVTELTIELPPTGAFREGERVTVTPTTESEDR